MRVDDQSRDDRTLVEACVAGDVESFGPLIGRYERPIFNIAYRMVGNADDARDVTQATFIKAYEKLRLFDPRYRFFSWIYRIAVNESINFVKARRPSALVDEQLPWSGNNPEEEYRARTMHDRLLAAVSELSLEHRVVIVLRHFMHQSYLEIAVVLQIPEKTVKSRLFAARRRLCAILTQPSATNR